MGVKAGVASPPAFSFKDLLVYQAEMRNLNRGDEYEYKRTSDPKGTAEKVY